MTTQPTLTPAAFAAKWKGFFVLLHAFEKRGREIPERDKEVAR